MAQKQNIFFVLIPPDFTDALVTDQPITAPMTLDSPDGPFTVIAATNATPIEIQTSAAHNLLTGRSVTIRGVQGNTNANGKWVIQVTASDKFRLIGSIGNAAYTSGGAVDPTNVFWNGSITLGQAILEHDVEAINEGVVSPQNVFGDAGVHVY